MKTILEFLGVLRSLIILLLLAGTFWWLWNPYIPGVHGTWNYLLQAVAVVGEIALLRWIIRSGKKSASKSI